MRRRIVSLSVLASVLAISLFGVPLAAGVARYSLADERGEVERVATQATLAISADVLRGGVPPLPELDDEVALGLYDAAGRRIAGTGPEQGDEPVRDALVGEVAGDDGAFDFVVAVPIVGEDTVVGEGTAVAVVRAVSSRWEVYGEIAGTWLLMLGIAAVAVALTWLLARLQARRLALPIEDLAVSATRLGEGDFSVRTRRSGIPEVDAAAACLDATADRVHTLITREREFSADASHQLRTPLTGLKLRLEAALDDPSGDVAPTLVKAIETVDRLEDTIADLLALARHLPERRTPLDVAALTAELANTWDGDATGRPLSVTVDPDLPPSTASAAAVRQILAVLLDNALRHGSGAVALTVRDAAGSLAFDVRDEGTITTPTALFRRTPTHEGHGIGLPMAHTLAEAENGRLTLTTPTPTTFTLHLPQPH
ncbi:HAMP domain-containing sensor histidine kinase [Actinocorallia sp. A-T 12471]|uniref:sensor histidine kinase n=1 Tax=Actinocorallia sp. A-T 12471 TaxID=3089813 RepID=UPI0029D11EDF|nr:HAMP domain-containing sensor histidine kinase [Actinocorallia sp. A-T 12471]MDX6744221.1 HAMP domain-containing sensor histidine kinase [Actinocorallia sp. A-T 12471]